MCSLFGFLAFGMVPFDPLQSKKAGGALRVIGVDGGAELGDRVWR